MQFWEGMHLALEWIRTEKLKSFFSVLGVIIGVMFLIVVVSVVEGMDRYIREDFASEMIGVNTVTVRRWPEVNINTSPEEWRERMRWPRLTTEDAQAIRERLVLPARVVVESRATRDVTAENGRTAENVAIVGASAEVFRVRDWTVERGRAFSAQEAERGVPVVVLGSLTAEVLFEEVDPVGRAIRIRGFPYRVVGVLEEQGSLFGQSLDGLAIAPARSPIRTIVAPRGYIDDIIVQAVNPEDVLDIKAEVEGIMRVRRRLRPRQNNTFAVETADDTLSFWDRISEILFLALPALVGISLVVGGIVIMNIMLVSVMERTREIGVRKAVGARRRDIMTQVIIETATLSSVGAALGIAAGIGIASLVGAVSPLPVAVAPTSIAVGVGLGVVVGMAAGAYPAWRASKLDPVDALRYE